MRLLVCGGRRFFNVAKLNRTLDDMHATEPITLVIHGLASGADTLAACWAERNGIPTVGYRAEWKRLGRPAGCLRNTRMLREGQPDKVLAFPGGRGTMDMIRQTRAAGVPLKVIE